MAIDVFYLTAHQKKLTGDHLKEMEPALGEALRSGHSQGPPSTLKPVSR